MQKAVIMSSCFSLLIVIGCASSPARWVSTREYTDTDYDRAWQIVVRTVTEDFDVDVIEKESGYLLTTWKPVTISTGEFLEGYTEAAVRITCKVEKYEPFVLKLRAQRGVLKHGSWQPRGTDDTWEKELLERIELQIK